MWFRDNDGNLITEEAFRWEPNPETGNRDSFGLGYEVVPADGGWVVDGMQTQSHGPALQWVRVTKDHSANKPPPLQWGYPDPDHPDEEFSVPFKDRGAYWEAEHDCSNRYYPDRSEGEHMYQGPYFHYIMGENDMVKGTGFVAGTGYKTAIVYYKPSGAVTPPQPEDRLKFYGSDGKRISIYDFAALMGSAYVATPSDLRDGEAYLKIVELWIREVPRPRYARLMVRRENRDRSFDAVPEVPFKFFTEGMVLLEGVTNAAGTGQLELGSSHAYAVPGKGPLNLRIKRTYHLKAEQFRDYGLVRIHDADNRHCDVIYEERVWGEEAPIPDPDPDPDPDPGPGPDPDPGPPDPALLVIITKLDLVSGLLTEIRDLS